MHVCECVCICVCTCVSVCLHTCMCVCVSLCVRVRVLYRSPHRILSSVIKEKYFSSVSMPFVLSFVSVHRSEELPGKTVLSKRRDSGHPTLLVSGGGQCPRRVCCWSSGGFHHEWMLDGHVVSSLYQGVLSCYLIFRY